MLWHSILSLSMWEQTGVIRRRTYIPTVRHLHVCYSVSLTSAKGVWLGADLLLLWQPQDPKSGHQACQGGGCLPQTSYIHTAVSLSLSPSLLLRLSIFHLSLLCCVIGERKRANLVFAMGNFFPSGDGHWLLRWSNYTCIWMTHCFYAKEITLAPLWENFPFGGISCTLLCLA